MKLSSAIVGQGGAAQNVRVDRRWLMAYNAALGELSAAPHPVFPVCYEWETTRALRESSGLQKLNARLVHAQHDLTIHRPAQEEELAVSARIVGASQRRPGAFVVIRLEARGAGGDKVSTSDYGMLYRDVTLEGGERALERHDNPPEPSQPLEKVAEIAIAATAAHVYTECARIWNPIHTDRDYARAAGLPDIILHGTATLAHSVSALAREWKLDKVSRVRCRFGAMVTMPCTLTVHARRVGDAIAFETRTAGGAAAIERGWIG